MGKKVAEIAAKLRFFIDYLPASCYNFIVARYCAQALDTLGALASDLPVQAGNRDGAAVSRPHKAQVLLIKYVAGKAAEIQCRVNGWMRHQYSSAWLCIVFFQRASGLFCFSAGCDKACTDCP